MPLRPQLMLLLLVVFSAGAAAQDTAPPPADSATADAVVAGDSVAAEPPKSGILIWPWRLWHYFQASGVISVLAWLAVLALAVRFALRHPGGRVFAIFALLGAFGLFVAISTDNGQTFAWLGAIIMVGLALTLVALGRSSVQLVVFAGLVLIGVAYTALTFLWDDPLPLLAWGVLPLAMLLIALDRWPLSYRVVLMALVAVLFGQVNSNAVSDIQIDRSAVIAKLEQARREAAERAATERRLTSTSERFATAEMSAEDKAALEAAGQTDDQADRYTYRDRGKQAIDSTKFTADPNGDLGFGPTDEDDPDTANANAAPPRVMLEQDVTRANQWDRWNLAAVRFAPWLALLMLLTDYIWRLGRTTGARSPMPIDNRYFDMLFPKARRVLFKPDRDALARLLTDAVRKGQAFIYLGPTDLWPQSPSLARLHVAPLRLFRAATGPLEAMPLPKQVISSADVQAHAEFIFESSWFGRGCFVLTCANDTGQADAALRALLEHLRVRKIPQAATRRTVLLVWDVDQPPSAAQLDQLGWLLRQREFQTDRSRSRANAIAGVQRV